MNRLEELEVAIEIIMALLDLDYIDALMMAREVIEENGE